MDKLNVQQKAAVLSDCDTVVVIAGAGSGKTTVLTKKITKLILEDQIYPSQILAITFTNKAASEMKERVIDSVGPLAMNTWIMTFHGFALKLLVLNSEYLKDIKKSFLIIDEGDKKRIISSIIKRQNLSDIIKVKSAIYAISNAKSKSLLPNDVEKYLDYDYVDIYKEYKKYLNENNSCDFDDLLLYANELLDIEEISTKYSDKFKYIHVDEFQDTSVVQFELLKKLNCGNKMFIVGDIDQSIYGWRGADVLNLINVEENFSNCEIIKLEQNYRSTKNILNAANNLIVNNNTRIEKNLWTDSPTGQKINSYRFEDAYAEADFISNEIKFNLDMGKKAAENAVLFRYNYQSKKIEEKLIKQNIPYKIYGGLRFFERMEVKDIISFMRLIYNNSDNVSFNRVINVPKRKVGEVTISKFLNHSIENNTSLFAASKELGNHMVFEFCEIIRKYRVLLDSNFDLEFDNLLKELKYEQHLVELDGSDKVIERYENIKELKNSILFAINGGQDIYEYLNELVLFTEREDDIGDCVVLSTIHGVKGLEFDNVYMISMGQGLFPKRNDILSLSELEEERRVCYVGITRAKKKLVTTNYEIDFRGQYYENSIFLEEMDVKTIYKGTEFNIF